MDNPRLDKLLKFYKADPNDAFILFALAKEYEQSQNLDTALEHYNELKSKHPDYVGVYYHLAKLHEKLEDFDAALESYTVGIDTAEKLNDQHALAELKNAKVNLEIEEGL